MKLKQYQLFNIDKGSYSYCWLDGDLKVGNIITLKDAPGDKYKVMQKYDKELSLEDLGLNRNPEWYSV